MEPTPQVTTLEIMANHAGMVINELVGIDSLCLDYMGWMTINHVCIIYNIYIWLYIYILYIYIIGYIWYSIYIYIHISCLDPSISAIVSPLMAFLRSSQTFLVPWNQLSEVQFSDAPMRQSGQQPSAGVPWKRLCVLGGWAVEPLGVLGREFWLCNGDLMGV